MSSNPSDGRGALYWRGPLLAAAVFAATFAILLLIAHQSQSNTSDEGSSFRRDPYGASLLFDSYERAGYRVERSQDERAIADQDASRTTAFFIGGHSRGDWEIENGKLRQSPRFRQRLEDFLSRGGRVVLVEPAWGSPLKSDSQGWQVETESSKAPHETGPAWAAPDLRAMPSGSEAMYLGSEAPWLKTDQHWIALYAGPLTPVDGKQSEATDGAQPAHAYMAMRRVGNGELIAASQESFVLNEVIKTHPNPALLDFLAGGRPLIWVDETLHGMHQDEGVLWLVQRYRLQAALLLFWASLLMLLWSMSGDLVRRPAPDRNAEIIWRGEGAGVAVQRLLQRSIAAEQVLAECWDQFRRRSPHDAQAIAADSHWGPRLRAALVKDPLAGYQELSRLIAERRASAKGLGQASRDGHRGVPAS